MPYCISMLGVGLEERCIIILCVAIKNSAKTFDRRSPSSSCTTQTKSSNFTKGDRGELEPKTDLHHVCQCQDHCGGSLKKGPRSRAQFQMENVQYKLVILFPNNNSIRAKLNKLKTIHLKSY